MPDLHLLSPQGFRATAVHAGIKSKQTPDVALLICDKIASAAAVFTTNKVIAAPVIVGRRNIRSGKLRGIVVNAGNANACTGKQGLKDAERMCALAASVADCKPSQILPSSTGIIGQLLPMRKIERGIIEAAQYLGSSLEHANLFADAILTTDLVRKTAATEVKLGRRRITLAGVCKGSGMIGPRLDVPHATMLAYLTTDADVPAPLLKKLLKQSADVSFNTVTVDDHASTNDTAVLLASGASGAKLASKSDQRKFAEALTEVCQSLAYQIAADGEGAKKVVIINVRRAKSDKAAQAIARTIANSPLVKTAMHGNDPNWGRIVSAAGNAGVPFNPDTCILTLQGTKVFTNGTPVPFSASQVSAALKKKEVTIDLDCRSGAGQATCWTCDLSKDYITINADYHT
jgi:glutamate N-acetyltransferase/amino-acid N-acetyltransferase